MIDHLLQIARAGMREAKVLAKSAMAHRESERTTEVHAMLSKDSRRTSCFCSSPVYPCAPGAIQEAGVCTAPTAFGDRMLDAMQQLEVRVRMRYYAIRIPNGQDASDGHSFTKWTSTMGPSSVIAVKLSRACLTYLVPCMQALGKSGTTHIWCFVAF